MTKNFIDRLKRTVASLPLVRRFALKVLKSLASDIFIRNPYTGDKVLLNSYKHKGYWYFGRSRERETMNRFSEMILPGSTVVEVGGHIGFISQYFSKIVGPSGRVIVFEPGANNLPYIQRNVGSKSNITLERLAISDRSGTADFYEDNITGQNNSLLSDYGNASSVARSHGERLEKHVRSVDLVTLDSYLETHSLSCDFVKIDIEGLELSALRGMSQTLRSCKYLMVEVTENQVDVSKILLDAGFRFENIYGERMTTIGPGFAGNVFAIKSI